MPPDTGPEALKLYRIGAVLVLLFVLTGIIIPMAILNSLDHDTELAGQGLIGHIVAHRW